MGGTEFIDKWADDHLKKLDDPQAAAARRDNLRAAYRDWKNAARHVLTEDDNDEIGKPNLTLELNFFPLTGSLSYPVAALVSLDRTSARITIQMKEIDDSYGPSDHRGQRLPHFVTPRDADISREFLGKLRRRLCEASASGLDWYVERALGRGTPINFWDSARRVLWKHAQASEKTNVNAALGAFLRRLDQRALRILRAAHLLDQVPAGAARASYEWLTGRQPNLDGNGARPAAAADAIRNRQDTAAIFPGLLLKLKEDTPKNANCTAEIDCGAPRIDVLARHFADMAGTEPFSTEFMHWLRGKDWRDFRSSRFRAFDGGNWQDLPMDLAVGSALPRQWRPRNAEEWETCHRLHDRFNSLATMLARPPAEIVGDFARICHSADSFPDRLLTRGGSVQESLALNERQIDIGFHGHLHDFLTTAARPVVVPALARRTAALGCDPPAGIMDWAGCNPGRVDYIGDRMSAAIFKGLSLTKLFNLAQRWHERAARLQERTNRLSGDFAWPALTPALTSPEGVRIECLNSSLMLEEEGKEMAHCVGGYTYQCVVGTSHIYRLTNADGERATLELREKDQHFSLGQVQSHANQNSPEWAREATHWLTTQLNDKVIDVDWKVLREQQEQRRRDYSGRRLQNIIGFDPLNAADVENAYAAWHHEMPGLYPEATLDECLERRGLNAMLDKEIGPLPAPMALRA